MTSTERELVLPIIRDDNICLPLAINAVARYWDVKLPMKEAVEIAKKYTGVNGSILIEGIELAERHGLESIVVHSSLSDLKRIIDMGVPPIVIIPGMGNVVQHASVISGYDDAAGTIMHYIPEEADGEFFKVGMIPELQFDRIWSEDGRLIIVVAPSTVIGGVPMYGTDAAKSGRLCFLSERFNLLKDPENAIRTLKEAISLDRYNSTAYSLLGSTYNGEGSAECIPHYTRSIQLNTRSFLAYRGLGNYYLKKQNFFEAEQNYTRAIGINPVRYGSIYKNRAIARMQQGKNHQCKRDLEEYIKLIPNAPDADEIRKAISELD